MFYIVIPIVLLVALAFGCYLSLHMNKKLND